MKETAVQFGKSVKLSGIISLPREIDKSLPAVIFFNSGMRHHVGCCRMSVLMARELATLGFPCFRFDLSGVGDSLPRSDGLDYQESAMVEAREAMDYLGRTLGVNSFVLYGLCSGAHLGFKMAQEDERVKGLIQIDGYLYRTRRYYLHHLLKKLADPGIWYRLFANRIPRLLGMKSTDDTNTELAGDSRIEVEEWPEEPSRESSEKGYRKLLDNGTQLLVFVTGSPKDRYNYQGQFRDMFPSLSFDGFLKDIYMPFASHILAEEKSQYVVMNTIRDWVRNCFLSP